MTLNSKKEQGNMDFIFEFFASTMSGETDAETLEQTDVDTMDEADDELNIFRLATFN